ncbi:MAG TPA: helix-turn-helix domain-containing protein [Gemmatimonadaceae bacterium]
MPRSLAVDLRLRVVKAYEAENVTMAAIGRRFGVGEASVDRWVSQWRKTRSLTPRPHGGGFTHRVDEKGLQVMRELLEGQPDATRVELARTYKSATGVSLSVATVGRALFRLGFTRKKRPFTPRSGKPSG